MRHSTLKKWDKLIGRPVTQDEARGLEARAKEIMDQGRSKNFAEMQAASERRNRKS
jgi:hypothetical protein